MEQVETHYHRQVSQEIQLYLYLLVYVQYQQYMHILELENITIFINGKNKKIERMLTN